MDTNRDFIRSPIRTDHPKIPQVLDDIHSLNFDDYSETMRSVLKYRELYIRSNDKLYFEVSRCIFKILTWYTEIVRERTIPIMPLEYLTYSLRFKGRFSNLLSKIRKIACLTSITNDSFIDLKHQIEEINKNNLFKRVIFYDEETFNYDDFLHEQFLIFFDEEDEEDYKYALEASVPMNSQVEDLFRSSCLSMLKTYKSPTVKEVNVEQHVLTNDSTSFSLEDNITGVHKTIVRKRIDEGKTPYGQLTHSFLFKRKRIPVAPANFRDSFESELNTLFTIRSISYVMKDIVSYLPFSAMTDNVKARRRKRFIMRKKPDKSYFMLDFKKSGLTLPHGLLKILMECLEEVYPEIDVFKYIDGFFHAKVLLNDRWVPIKRGTGLGNANELYTLMQCVFGFIYKKRYDLRSIFFNDDSVYEVTSPRKQVAFLCSLIEKTGLLINYEKAIISDSNVFCEEYILNKDLDYTKKQLLVLPLCDVIYQTTISQAKEFIYSVDKLLIGTGFRCYTKTYMELGIQMYGSEFQELDRYLPYQLGGWIDFSKTNFSCLIEYMCDPNSFLDDSGRSRYNFINSWILWNLSESQFQKGIFNSKSNTKIYYRHKVDAFKAPRYNYVWNSFVKNLEQYFDTDFNSIERINDVLNIRGYHNAKPNLILGLRRKEYFYRQKIFKDFKNRPYTEYFRLNKDAISVTLILRCLRDVENRPGKLSYPLFLVKESIEFPHKRVKNFLSVVKSGESINSLDELYKKIDMGLFCLLDKRYIKYCDPFIFQRLWRSVKSGYIISDIPLIIYNEKDRLKIPSFEAFGPNMKLLATDLLTRLGKYPTSFENIDVPMTVNPRDIKDLVRNAVNDPGYDSYVDSLKKSDKEHLYNFIKDNISIRGEDDKKQFLRFIEDVSLEDLSDDTPEEILSPEEEDLDLFFIEIDQEHYISRFKDEEYTIDELLDEDSSSSESMSFDEESIEYYSGSDESLNLNEARRAFRAFD
jgi:hypothetical protein